MKYTSECLQLFAKSIQGRKYIVYFICLSMSLYFVTWNTKKFTEAKLLFPDLEQWDIDLPEIQSLDSQEIVRYKLDAALTFSPTLLSQWGSIIVEDTSLVFDAWNGLPGPLVKWYLQSVGGSGMWQMLQSFPNKKAQAICTIGYSDGEHVEFFQWITEWIAVEPIWSFDFGRDALFLPDGCEKTFGQMTKEEKNAVSHRGKALELLRDFLID